jgi:membrane protein
VSNGATGAKTRPPATRACTYAASGRPSTTTVTGELGGNSGTFLDIPLGMHRVISAFREAVVAFSRDGCAFLAQSVAFNALFALFPLTVLALSGLTYVLPQSQHRALAFFAALAPTLHDYLVKNLETYMYGRGISSIIAVAFLVWSGKNLFMGLAYALDRAMNVPQGRPLVHNLALSLVMLPVTGILLAIAIALPIGLSITFHVAGIHDPRRITHILAYLISLALVFIVAVVLYRWLPNRDVPWSFALRGAAVVAVAWPPLQYAFAAYLTHVDFTRIYGALSAPLVLLLWFYCIGSIFLFGAEYSIAWPTGHSGDLREEVALDA